MQLLMAQVGLSGLTGDWRAVVRFYCKLVLLAEHWRLLGAAADGSGWPEWAGWILFIMLVNKIFAKFFSGPEFFFNVTTQNIRTRL